MSAATTSAPIPASAFALSEFTSLTNARARKSLPPSFWMARTNPPPCAPVAPSTAMIFVGIYDPFQHEEEACSGSLSVVLAKRGGDDRLGFFLYRAEMLGAREALGVDLVDVLRARRTRCEPAAIADDLDAA